MSYKAVILDLDGTLIESLPGIEKSANKAFEELNFPSRSTSEIRSFIGDGSWMLCRKALPDEPDHSIDIVNKAFKKHYPNEWKEGTSIFKGIFQFLETCLNNDIKLTILSNKPHAFTTEIVSQLFSTIPFAAIKGQQDSIAKKPAPESTLLLLKELNLSAEEVLFIGDSTVDIQTAQNAGTNVAAVTWGYDDLDTLEAENPNYIAHNIEELTKITIQ